MTFPKRSRFFYFLSFFFIFTGAATVFALVFNLFGPPELYETGKHPLDVAIYDLNSDSNLDVVTANRDGRSISVFMGNGDGTLAPLNEIATDGGATSIAVADMNSDGKADLVVSTCEEMCDASHIAIFTGKGDGLFEPFSETRIEGVAYNILLADFNSDALPDVAASDYPNARIDLLLSTSEPGKF